jgi:serine/threonine protein phosphatase PrpC
MMVQAAASTSTGRVRKGNEDSFGYRTDYGFSVVCDGMGGAAGGEVASRMTVEILLRRMTEGEGETFAERRERLHAAIAEANRLVLERADRDTGLMGMGTTLVALLLDSAEQPTRALVAHAGDSRCYRLRAGKLERITQDHSLVDEQIRLGNMTAEEAEHSPFRSVITRAIGTQPSVNEEAQELAIEGGDVFLLCSDGLTREVAEEEIARVLGAGDDLERAAHVLVDAANEHGGRDNVTCVVVGIRD